MNTSVATRRPQTLPLPMTAESAPASAAWDAAAVLRAVAGEAAGIHALIARGGAFRDAMVADGDVVLVERHVDLRDGELAAVQLPGDAQVRLRRVRFEGDTVAVRPETGNAPSTRHERPAVRVLGRVIAIARRGPAAA